MRTQKCWAVMCLSAGAMSCGRESDNREPEIVLHGEVVPIGPGPGGPTIPRPPMDAGQPGGPITISPPPVSPPPDAALVDAPPDLCTKHQFPPPSQAVLPIRCPTNECPLNGIWFGDQV